MTYFHRAKDPKEDTLPKVIENTKTSIIVLGKNTSEIIKKVLTEMHLLRKPHSVKLTKKNEILPFEDATSLEFFSEKNDSSLFLFGNHSKKRPHNLILGRMFNYKLLDMVELGVEEFKEMNKSTAIVNQAGSKPCLLFQGPHFENDETLKVVKNMFMDFFRLDVVKKINVLGLDHVIVITSLSEKKLHFGHYSIRYTQAPSSAGTMTDVPLVELIDCGPSMFLNVRRSKFASEDLRKEAMKIPDQLKKSKSRNKNITINPLGDMEGRIHIQQQNIAGIATRRFKAFKKGTEEEEENIREALEGEGVEGEDVNESVGEEMETD